MTERGKGSAMDAHMGPLRLPKGHGTLTAADRDEIWKWYKVSASVRYRQQWGKRCLSLSGQAANLNAARDYALQKIEDNGDGGRVEPVTTQQMQQVTTQLGQLDHAVKNHAGTLQYLEQMCSQAGQAASAANAAALATQQSCQRAVAEAAMTAHRLAKSENMEGQVEKLVRKYLQEHGSHRRRKHKRKKTRRKSPSDHKEESAQESDDAAAAQEASTPGKKQLKEEMPTTSPSVTWPCFHFSNVLFLFKHR